MGKPRDFFAYHLNKRMRTHGVRDSLRKQVTIHGERRAGGHTMRIGGAHDDGSQAPHFFLEQANRVVQFVAAKGVRADELGESIRLVNSGGTDGAHLVHDHADA